MNTAKGSERDVFFSVVIPVYNGESCIGRCVESVLSQTFSELEVVVVNDGSTDNTASVLEKLSEKDERVRVITVENGGVFCARARGAHEARGAYLTYCDDDDVYSDSRAFEKIYERVKDEEFGLVQYGYLKKFNHLGFKENPVKKEKRVGREEFYEKEYPFVLSSRNIASSLMLNTVTKFYHRSLYKKAPKPEGLERLFMGDDLVLNLYMLEDCPSALYIPDVYYTSFRLQGDSGKYRKGEMHNLDIIKEYQLSFLEKWNGTDKKEVERLHHLETADWFLLHVENSLEAIGEEETAKLISEVLCLPAFVRARQYFENNREDTLPVKLLLNADAEEYIEAAKKRLKGISKKKIYSWLKEKIVYKV